MTNDEDAFLRKILENPADDVTRLVYADWLQEREEGAAIPGRMKIPAKFAHLDSRFRKPISQNPSPDPPSSPGRTASPPP